MKLGTVTQMKLEEINAEDAGGGSGNDFGYDTGEAKPTEAPVKSEEKPAGDAPPAQALEAIGDGDPTLDEFGYKKTDASEKPEDKKPEQKKADEPEEVKGGATGYEEADPVVEAPAEEKPEAPPVEDTTKDLGYNLAEVKFDTIPDTEKDAMSNFIKTNKVPKDLVEKYVEMRKGEIAEFNKAQAKMLADANVAKSQQRASWHKELKEDSTFGGTDFAKNIHRADKAYADFMPETKKALTKMGSMLPPYVMRDLAALGKKLYATDTLQQGSAPVSSDGGEDDGLDEYGYAKV